MPKKPQDNPVSTVTSTTLRVIDYGEDPDPDNVMGDLPIPTELSAASVSPTHESLAFSNVKRKNDKPKLYTSDKSNMGITSETLDIGEYLEEAEDSRTDETRMQLMMGASSAELPSVGDEHSHTAACIPQRNLNIADIPSTQSAECTEREVERSPTI